VDQGLDHLDRAYEERGKRVHGWSAAHRPWWRQTMVGASNIAPMILLFWKRDEESNRYGPNPRDGAPNEEAQLA
jgi:hypothetical protein